MTKEKSKEIEYFIKVPIFSSEPLFEVRGIFPKTYESLVEDLIGKVNIFNDNGVVVPKNYRNSTQKKEINKIECFKEEVLNRPSILLQISSYKTNIGDGFIETETLQPMKKEYKFGSDNYFVLLVPSIEKIDSFNSKTFWTILIYADPFKETDDIISTIKLALQKILHLKIFKVHRKDVINEMNQLLEADRLDISYYSINNLSSDEDVELLRYRLDTSSNVIKKSLYENVPTSHVIRLLGESKYLKKFQKRVIKLLTKKKEYKIITTEDINEINSKISESIEVSFNKKFPISMQDRESGIFENAYILEIFSQALRLYY